MQGISNEGISNARFVMQDIFLAGHSVYCIKK